MLLQLAQNESVNEIAHPSLILDLRRFRSHRRDVGPVGLVFRAPGNPLLQQFLLRRRELLVGLERRHHIVQVRVVDAADEFAFVWLARDDGLLFQCDIAYAR